MGLGALGLGSAPPLRRQRNASICTPHAYQCLAFGRFGSVSARARLVLEVPWSLDPPRRALLLYCTTPYLDEWTPGADAASWKRVWQRLPTPRPAFFDQ